MAIDHADSDSLWEEVDIGIKARMRALENFDSQLQAYHGSRYVRGSYSAGEGEKDVQKSEVGHDGLVVENATGPAARAGIRAGDVIVSVGATKVTTLEQLKRQVEKSGDHVALLIERNGQKIFVPVRVG